MPLELKQLRELLVVKSMHIHTLPKKDQKLSGGMRIFMQLGIQWVCVPSQLQKIWEYFLINAYQQDYDSHPHVGFQNGNFNYQTGEFVIADPRYYNTAILEYNYLPDQTDAPPVWADFLNTMIPEPSDVQLLEAYLYYLLTPDVTQVQQALFLVGPHQCGKNTLMDVIGSFFPNYMISTKSFESLCKNEFCESFLKEKFYNWSDEAESISFDHSTKNKFKEWIGKRDFTVNKKNCPDLVFFKNKCRFIFTANYMPPQLAADSAVKSRARIIQCFKRFANPDPEIGDRMKLEADKIISYLINNYWDCYQSILCQRVDPKEADLRWNLLTNPIERFVKLHLTMIEEEDVWTPVKDLYDIFCTIFEGQTDLPDIKWFSRQLKDYSHIPKERKNNAWCFNCKASLSVL